MVHINLDPKYSLTSDNLQWILLKDGRPYWFFQSLEQLLLNYLSLKLRSSNAKLINNLIDSSNKQQERLCTLLTSISFKSKLPILASGKNKLEDRE